LKAFALPFFHIFLLVDSGAALRAAELQSWHGLDAEILQRGSWSFRLRGDVRWTGPYKEVYQYRGGPEVRWSPTGRYTLVGMFQAIEGKGEFERFDESSRFFGGFEWVAPLRRLGALSSRSAVERFIGGDSGDYNRYRQSERVRWNLPLRPTTGCELLWDRAGFLTVRPQTSISLPINEHGALEITYIHDRRRQDAGALRHIIRTEFRLHTR
jgi:hypothetical protein